MPFGKKKLDSVFIRLKKIVGKNENTKSAPGDSACDIEANETAVSGYQGDVHSNHDDPSNEWFAAVATGDLDKVDEMLRAELIDVDAADEKNWAAIHICAWNGYAAICEKLLAASCAVDAPGPGQVTALSLACQQGHADVAERLLSARCDVNRSACLGSNAGVTALHLAARHGHVGVVTSLLAAGAHVNVAMTTAGGVQGVTPLHLAVEAGHMDVMDVLIDAGCDVQSSTQSNHETLC